MTPEVFATSINRHVVDSAVDSTISILESPPLRIASQDLSKASAWYAGLPEAEKQLLLVTIRQAADYAAFGFCCILDGARVIASTNPKTEFRLVAISGDGTEVTLNPPDGHALHDLLKMTS